MMLFVWYNWFLTFVYVAARLRSRVIMPDKKLFPPIAGCTNVIGRKVQLFPTTKEDVKRPKRD